MKSQRAAALMQGPPSSVFSVRQSESAERNQIMRFLENAMHVHMHADWSHIGDWLAQPSSLLFLRDSVLKGYVAATLDPAPVAWVRAVAVDLFDPQRALSDLLAQLKVVLSADRADRIACMAVLPWLDHELPELGFVNQHTLGTMVKQGMDIPTLKSAKLLIRPADSAEFHAVAAIDQSAFDNPLWWHSVQQLERGAQRALHFDVAFDGHYPVGFIYGLRAGRKEAHIVRVAVAPSHHGRGIGAALVAHALRTYRQNNLTSVTLNTQISNVAAHRLYRRFGFEMADKRYPVWELPL